MARTILPPSPFPADIDRSYFGAYVSGFTDGEGCFGLHSHVPRGRNQVSLFATFSLYLRADDLPVLRLIQSFFGCGTIHYISRDDQRRAGHDTKDSFRLTVTRTPDLVSRVIPHFDRCPLYAKKGRDFAVWKEGVLLLDHWCSLPRVYTGRRGGQKWTPGRVKHFHSFIAALKATREYNAPAVPLLPDPPRPADRSLFD